MSTTPMPIPISVPVLAQPPAPKLPFLQKYKTNTTAIHSAPNPDEEDIGLAYDKEDKSEIDPDSSRTSISSHSVYSSTTRLTRDFITSPPPLPPPSSSPKSPPRRSHTAPTTGPRGGTAGVPSPLGPVSPPSLQGAMRSMSDAKQRRQRDPQDTFANTQSEVASPMTPISPSGSAIKTRVRICVKCDMRIENGRWIRMDSNSTKGGILCELCWKSMYLPKSPVFVSFPDAL
ncbi:hypothetical protein Clacol_006810 [Clathrus columnatus]|uniref:GATA-type domain-containing protein n=1 Tax=Clathrus columnatus TaxID=1419009 RepID=A0AAV5AFY6_9AGAM|nr:hypothetical protein Clacol_006810 [Clathrus columnatus]